MCLRSFASSPLCGSAFLFVAGGNVSDTSPNKSTAKCALFRVLHSSACSFLEGGGSRAELAAVEGCTSLRAIRIALHVYGRFLALGELASTFHLQACEFLFPAFDLYPLIPGHTA
ncbi:hypothetical protein FIBSPDRAFT_321230 [Athelia psychrophila]|uniref:Secreted protein n=1 Tax=Athelia psychrophila TaxID=1759441 RepID=A0A166QIU1_9AGAM|nr:hypothetical protein FIBSPDRAFT_321230 [Fibularhizoctonia sp. CBS 109695]